MKRSSSYGLVLFILASAWIFMKVTKVQHSERVNWFADVSPWYLLIVFGCYCLAKLGYDLLTFNDYPKEIKKLEQVLHDSPAVYSPSMCTFIDFQHRLYLLFRTSPTLTQISKREDTSNLST